MCLSKKVTFFLLFFCFGFTCFSQDIPEQDSLLIIDTIQSPVEQAVDEQDDDEQTASSVFSTSRNFNNPDTASFRMVSDSVAAALKKQKAFEYANDPEYWKKENPVSELPRRDLMFNLLRFFARPSVRAFIYLMLIALAVFLIIKVIIVNKLYIFKSSSKKPVDTGPVSDEELTPENLDEKIKQALAQNDQRSAVRYLYLKTLQLLDKKGWITLHAQSTNQIYRNQVNHFARGKEFGFLSNVYEYVWYGKFHLTQQQFNLVLHNFTHFQSSLKV